MNPSSHKSLWYSAVVCATGVVILCAGVAQSARSRQDTPTTGDDPVPSRHETLEPNSPVAVVDGVTIPYSAIRAIRSSVESQEPSVDAKVTTRETKEEELRRLAARIHQIVLNRKLQDLGINASREEIEARIEEIVQRSGATPDDLSKMREQIQALHSALAEWHNDPSAADRIYRERLRPLGVSEEQWRLFRASFDTPEKLKKLKVPKNIEEMKRNSRQSAKMDVLHSKLDKHVVGKVSVSDEEVRTSYQTEYGNVPNAPAFDEVKDRVREKLLDAKCKQARLVWWREQYKNADIQIKHPAYASVIDRLLSSWEVASPERDEPDQPSAPK